MLPAATVQYGPVNPVPEQQQLTCAVLGADMQVQPFWQGGLQTGAAAVADCGVLADPDGWVALAATLQYGPVNPVPEQLQLTCAVSGANMQVPPFWQGGLQTAAAVAFGGAVGAAALLPTAKRTWTCNYQHVADSSAHLPVQLQQKQLTRVC